MRVRYRLDAFGGREFPNSRCLEADLREKQEELAALRTELAEREVQLASFQTELSAFEGKYLREVGALYAELDDWKARVSSA